ncbi:MFS transporter, ACS family, solute carrier family 17 [Acrasis kona]|uniref:MFS transporter, ACS family, solute carrier family 17 n=1 Tax=Acrasis kona TaxID=1008807 RepID=A0AAW2YN73_9EUKA
MKNIDLTDETPLLNVQDKPSFYIPQRYILSFMILLSNLICYLNRALISVAIIPMSEQYNWNNVTQANILSAFFYGYLVTQLPGAFISKWLGGKVVLFTGVCVWCCFTLVTPIAADLSEKWFGWIIIARVGLGLGQGVNFPAVNHLSGIWIPKPERTTQSTVTSVGLEIGTLSALIFSPLISNSIGWEWTFYIYGFSGIIWGAFYLFFTSATPQDNTFISGHERHYIEKTIQDEVDASAEANQSNDKSERSLFVQIISNMGVWAVVVAHTCFNYQWYILLSYLPKLFLYLGVSFERVGLFTMLPYIVVAVMSVVSGVVSDALINKAQVSVANVRKIMQCLSLIVPSICYFVLRFTMTNLILSTIVICVACGFCSFSRSGHNVNMIDLSPKYAGMLYSITNTFATVPGIISNLITGWLLDVAPIVDSTIPSSPWDNIFNVMIGVNLFGAVFYAAFARGTVQFK